MLMTRRSLIADALGLSVALPFVSQLAMGCARGREAGERVLVVLQLSGGNDGLNTVVPHRQDQYYSQRPSLAIRRNRLHKLDDDHGLHPNLRELAELFEQGQLACVQGVGYPQPDRSHFRSMEVWHTADPFGPPGRTGWLGRLADQVAGQGTGLLPAVHVGSGALPLAMRGEQIFAPTVRDAQAFRLHSDSEEISRARGDLLGASSGGVELNFLRQAASTTYTAAQQVQEFARRGSPIDYPGSPLARGLELIARLISGGFGARVFHIELGGFDTHVRQERNHEPLLWTLSQAVGAFQRDLEHHGVAQDVSTLIFSEFGRRVAENGSKGTDHGAGAPCFVVGRSVAGGLYGEGPDLSSLDEGDVPFSTDFRSVYTCLERDWMKLRPSSEVPALGLLTSS